MRSTDQANLLPRPFLLDAATDDLMDVDVGEPCVRSKFEIFKVLGPIFHRRADLSIASDETTQLGAISCARTPKVTAARRGKSLRAKKKATLK